MPKPITVLVAGATGRQGGAVARLLLEKGHRVRALTRRPTSQAAAELHLLGADILEADLQDRAAVARAAEGADGFFLMTTPFEQGIEAELRQGRRAAEGARDAGVKHLVFSSVASADRETGVPFFESKRAIETYIGELGLSFTVVAPTFFMENLLRPQSLSSLSAGVLSLPLPPQRRLQMIPLADLAGFVRVVLERPAGFQGRRIELASDDLTGEQAAHALARGTRSAIGFRELPLEAVRAQGEDYLRMWEWMRRVGHAVDLAGLRRDHPEVGWRSFAEWVRTQDWSDLDVASPEQPTA
jgi:uncharacterized protein YbjT (DUF2867 family)